MNSDFNELRYSSGSTMAKQQCQTGLDERIKKRNGGRQNLFGVDRLKKTDKKD